MINKLVVDDKDEFYELGKIINKNFDKLYNLENIVDSLYDDVYGYFIDNKLVGFIHINKMYENIDIVNIVVDEDYRRRKIGSKLISYVIDLYDDVMSIMLEVNENNINAIKLYEKMNFKEINRRLKYYGNDNAIIMKRDV